MEAEKSLRGVGGGRYHPPRPLRAPSGWRGRGGPSLGGSKPGGTQRLRRLLGPGSESSGTGKAPPGTRWPPQGKRGRLQGGWKEPEQSAGCRLGRRGRAVGGLHVPEPAPGCLAGRRGRGCFGVRAGAEVGSSARDPLGGGALGGLRPSPLPLSPDTHSASCLCRPVVSAAAALTCSCGERPPGGEGRAALGVGLSGPRRRRDPLCPAPEGGYPDIPEPSRRSPRGRAAAPVPLAFGVGGSRPRCPRCPSGACWGRRETKPGLSSGLPSRAWPCLVQAREGIWTRLWGYWAGRWRG